MIRKRSSKARLMQKIQDIMRDILKIERGDKCQLCGRESDNLGVFHVLPVGGYQRIRFNFENVLLTCWFPCHFDWHHNF